MHLTESQFNAHLSQHARLLEGFARNLAGNREDAEDLFSEAVTDIWCSYDPHKSDFGPFACGVMRRTWANMVEARSARKRIPREAMLSLDDYHGGSRLVRHEVVAAAVDKYEVDDESMPREKRVGSRRVKPGDPLSAREMEVMQLLTTDLSISQIADRLCISKRTVQYHVDHIYTCLDVARADGGNRMKNAVLTALRKGIVRLESASGGSHCHTCRCDHAE